MYSILGTIVLNVKYIAPEYCVQCSTILSSLFGKCSFCLFFSFLLSLHRAVLGHPKAQGDKTKRTQHAASLLQNRARAGTESKISRKKHRHIWDKNIPQQLSTQERCWGMQILYVIVFSYRTGLTLFLTHNLFAVLDEDAVLRGICLAAAEVVDFSF